MSRSLLSFAFVWFVSVGLLPSARAQCPEITFFDCQPDCAAQIVTLAWNSDGPYGVATIARDGVPIIDLPFGVFEFVESMPPGDHVYELTLDCSSPSSPPSACSTDCTGPPLGGSFLRGDVNADGAVNIADWIAVLEYLFAGGSVGCADSLDTNDDGSANISDAIYGLSYQFAGTPGPLPPFPDCGPDPTPDALDCTSYPGCASTPEEDLVGVLDGISMDLFGQPFDPEHWNYPLDGVVLGEGVFGGTNQFGQPFNLQVLESSLVDLNDIDITADQRQTVMDVGMTMCGVIAYMESDIGTVAVSGMAVSQLDASLNTVSFLILTNRFELDDEVVNPPADAVDAFIFDPILFPSFMMYLEIPQYCVDPTCVQNCEEDRQAAIDAAQDAYDAAVASAKSDYDAAVAAATAAYNLAVTIANNNYNTAIQVARNNQAGCLAVATAAYAAAMIGCAALAIATWWAGGSGGYACAIAASAVEAGAIAACAITYKIAIANAKAARLGEIANAQAVLDSATVTAKAAYDAALTAAKDTLDAAIAAAQTAFEACVAGCPFVVCGSFEICIDIFQDD